MHLTVHMQMLTEVLWENAIIFFSFGVFWKETF